VVGNRGDLRSLAERYDKPFYDVGDGNGNTDEERLLDLLAEYDVDLIVLARYMRILSPEVVFRYEGRIINVHPRCCRRSPARRRTDRRRTRASASPASPPTT